MAFVQFHQGIKIGDGLFGGIGDVPIERDFCVFAGGLKENLVVGTVINMQDEKGRPFFANWDRVAFRFWWKSRGVHGAIRKSVLRKSAVNEIRCACDRFAGGVLQLMSQP